MPDANAFTEAIELAVDFAAAMNCQRYGQFERINIDPTDYCRMLKDTLMWRELFSIPQVPPIAVATLREAFASVTWPDDALALRREVDVLCSELGRLLRHPVDHRLIPMSATAARSSYPLLWKHAHAPPGTAPPGTVNKSFHEPFSASERTHEEVVFFGTGHGEVLVLPRPLTTAAALRVIFRRVWSLGNKTAGDLVGAVVEKSIALGCRSRRPDAIWENERYRPGPRGREYEIDIATRHTGQLTLFEAKAKVLTGEARSMNFISFLEDYTKSYLSLLEQLVRHHRYLQQGTVPSISPATSDDNRVLKVAVSSLSFGPATDKSLANVLLCSMANAKLEATDDDDENNTIIERFNQKLGEVINGIDHGTERKDGVVNLFAYLLDVFWVDLGELLYLLHRA